MGACSMADIPANLFTTQVALASFASDAALTTVPIFVAPAAGTIVSVYTLASTSQATGISTVQKCKLVNLGTAGTGTTVVASTGIDASIGTLIPKAWAVTAGNTFAAGDMFVWTNATSVAASDGVPGGDCHMVIKYRLT